MVQSYPVSTISKLFGLSERRVQQLARDGVIPKPEKNQYELIGSVRSYIDYLQQRAFGKGVSPQDMHVERARLLKAQADMAEIELAEKSGALVAVERVESDWIQVLSACRAKLLSIPTKSAHQIVNLVEVYDVEKFLKQAIFEALEELAAYEIKGEDISADDASADESASSTAESDGEPVGG
jgi:phage terminase Nu1 subunit (DNA packaging protein)